MLHNLHIEGMLKRDIGICICRIGGQHCLTDGTDTKGLNARFLQNERFNLICILILVEWGNQFFQFFFVSAIEVSHKA